jgi:hypothetical protein
MTGSLEPTNVPWTTESAPQLHSFHETTAQEQEKLSEGGDDAAASIPWSVQHQAEDSHEITHPYKDSSTSNRAL